MISIETKRFYLRKYCLFIIIGFLLLILLDYVNTNLFISLTPNKNTIANNYYSVVSQIGILLFTPIIGMYFTDDYEKSIYIFYNNYGITKIKYYLSKLISPIFFSAIITFLISLPFLLIMGISLNVTIQTIILLIMDIVYYILIMAILSIIIKKRMTTIFSGMGLIVVMSIVNIMFLNMFSGKLFLLDRNSYLTHQVSLFMNEEITSCCNLMLMQIFLIIILLIVYVFIIMIKINKKKMNTYGGK